MSDSGKAEYKLWYYTPSVAGGAIACIVFCILTLLHCFRLFKNRTWYCIPFVIGGLVSSTSILIHGNAARANR